jgi:hypothetical protein
MSKNYYPQMLDELQKKDVTQDQLISWFCRHQPYSVIKAIQTMRKANLIKKAQTNIYKGNQYGPLSEA